MSFHPHTPQSPSQFSPATSDPLSSMNTSLTSITTALPTPAHSVNGSASQPFDLSHDIAMGDESPQKRKRALEDIGDRDRKKVHIDDSAFVIDEMHERGKLGFKALHMEVGEKYLLCRTPHPPSRPRTSDDLFEMYNLTGLAAEVAREKPNGEKNALRKTYKGHIKRLGITGHFDAHKFDAEKEQPKENLFHMLSFPELEWSVHEVKGKEMGAGLSDQMLGTLSKAMTMARGRVISKLWDATVLGDLAPGADGSRQASSAKPTAPSTPSATTPGAGAARPKAQLQATTAAATTTTTTATTATTTTAQGQDPARPKRNIKKRSYGDSSFEGYGEGFPDDDVGMETGYSSGGGDDRGGQKRRKKNPGNSQPQFPSTMRQQSYGPGMVGA